MNFISLLLSITVAARFSEAFTVMCPSRGTRSGLTNMKMGFFDGISKAFGNEEVRKTILVSYNNYILV